MELTYIPGRFFRGHPNDDRDVPVSGPAEIQRGMGKLGIHLASYGEKTARRQSFLACLIITALSPASRE